MDWPKNKDSDLLKRLASDGINLTQPHMVEFNIDFDHWPPSDEVFSLLKTKYTNVKLFEPGSNDELQEGYISVRVRSSISYEFVTNMQRELTEAVAAHGGYCNSWAVLLVHAEM